MGARTHGFRINFTFSPHLTGLDRKYFLTLAVMTPLRRCTQHYLTSRCVSLPPCEATHVLSLIRMLCYPPGFHGSAIQLIYGRNFHVIRKQIAAIQRSRVS